VFLPIWLLVLSYAAVVDQRVPVWLGAAAPCVSVAVWAVLMDRALSREESPQVNDYLSGWTRIRRALRHLR
jgi:hypothetical protein